VADTLDLRVVTPERPVYEGAALSVVVPAHDGEVGILPRHARFLATLGAGALRARTPSGVVQFFVEGGFVQVADNRVTVLCELALRIEEVDPAAAEAQAAAATTAAERTRLLQRAAAMRRVAGATPTAAHTAS
jgi:F-type H+-transporting ATPase subunit epsilon